MAGPERGGASRRHDRRVRRHRRQFRRHAGHPAAVRRGRCSCPSSEGTGEGVTRPEQRTRSDSTGATPGVTDDFVFTFSFETYADAARRGMMRPPDRIVMSLMRSPHVDRLLVANPFRWAPRVLASPVVDRDVPSPASARIRLHKPVRLRRSDRLDPADVADEYADYDA